MERVENRLRRFLRDEVVARAGYSSAVAAVSRAGICLGSAAAGWADRDRTEEARSDHLFDLASLTKPWIATLALALDHDGTLPLGTSIGDLWTAAPRHLAERSCEDLLRHRSGLRPWAPFYLLCRDGASELDVLGDPRFAGAAAGVYSDLGYILWRCLAEQALARPADLLLAERLGAAAHELRPSPVGDAAAWCGLGTGKEVELAEGLGFRASDLGAPPRGTAQDGNARLLGGLAGHAGLFGTLGALLRLGAAWLGRAATPDASAIERARTGATDFMVGWWRVQPGGGTELSAAAFGHPGFAGGSLWIDPERELVVAMLGHRGDPFRDLSPIRRELHRIAVELAETGG